MRLRKILILVEGQTEETFVRNVLAPHLQKHEIYDVRVTLLTTKRVKSGPSFKGGVTNFAQVEGDVRRLLGDSSATTVTTMFDYYGLPPGFPGLQTRPRGDPYQRVHHVESEFRKAIGDRRFEPFLTLHEFEAFVFADVSKCRAVFASESITAALTRVAQAFASPEEIDEGAATAPSKRIISIFPEYEKPLHGPLATLHVGLELLRERCRHFDGWVKKLETR